MSSIPQSEIKAIGKLLKSSDEDTLKLLEEQLKKFDTKTLKEINDELPLDDISLRKQYLDLVLKIKREQLKEDFKNWSNKDSSDLEKGVLLVASFANPLLKSEYYSKLLNDWSNTLSNSLKKLKISNDPTSIINELNHFLFMELGFKGNKEHYYDPENSFIDKVIDKKKGNPILLSVIYLLVAKRLGLPFNGVNMPAHFLIQYLDAFEPIYIDPFNQGEIITKSDCQERIKALKLMWQEDYLSGPTNKQIIARMMQNLVNIYQSEGLFELKEYMEYYVNILKR
ncbi:MAG: hypothetical protein HY094_04405 [Candidatus Melainabacteria bacterium]|nr:hypothetical protein [Candidatus Melainabacteria bacterium]